MYDNRIVIILYWCIICVKHKMMYVLSCAKECYFGVYFHRCFATREITTKTNAFCSNYGDPQLNLRYQVWIFIIALCWAIMHINMQLCLPIIQLWISIIGSWISIIVMNIHKWIMVIHIWTGFFCSFCSGTSCNVKQAKYGAQILFGFPT